MKSKKCLTIFPISCGAFIIFRRRVRSSKVAQMTSVHRQWPAENNAASPLDPHWAVATAQLQLQLQLQLPLQSRWRWRCIWWAHTSAGHELCSPNPFLPLDVAFGDWTCGNLSTWRASCVHFQISFSVFRSAANRSPFA